MRACHAYDYAVIRVVPQVEREEFVNVGVILSCPVHGFIGSRIALDVARLRALAPDVDEDVVRSHLAAFEAVCAGGPDAGAIGELPPRQRFHWLVAPRSTIIQASSAHTGMCGDPAETLERLFRLYVPSPAQ